MSAPVSVSVHDVLFCDVFFFVGCLADSRTGGIVSPGCRLACGAAAANRDLLESSRRLDDAVRAAAGWGDCHSLSPTG